MSDIERGMELMRLMKSVKMTIHQTMQKHFDDLNLTGPQGMVIGIIARHGAMKISDLSSHMGLSNSTISGIVDRIEKMGYVTRVRDENDRRVVRVEFTPEFKKTSSERFRMADSFWEEILTHGNDEERDIVIKGMRMLEELITRSQKEGQA